MGTARAAGLTNIHSYLDDIYAPVEDERSDALEVLEGELPPDLLGSFVQNSPNPVGRAGARHHWFDGDGMVHGVELDGRRATYRNRYVQTRGWLAERAAGRPLSRGILEPFTPGDPAPDKDTANTDLVVWDGGLYALWWLGGEPYRLRQPGLETEGPSDLGGGLTCGVAAHPKVDPRTGELIFFDYSVYQAPHLTVGVAAPGRGVVHTLPIDVPSPSLFHDIAITERYTILLDLPMTWDAAALRVGRRRVAFHADQPGRIGVMERHGQSVRWFEVPSCYVYHTVNAWEERDEAGHEVLVVTACRIENPIPILPHEQEPEIPRLTFLRLHPFSYEWRIDLTAGRISGRQLDDQPSEFPRMDDRYKAGPSRYAWHPHIAPEPTLMFDGLIRYDRQGPTRSYHFGEGRITAESVFCPRAGGQEEGDGYMVSFVNDRVEGRSELAILDAAQIEAGPVCRLALPRRVPFGFHATWAPALAPAEAK